MDRYNESGGKLGEQKKLIEEELIKGRAVRLRSRPFLYAQHTLYACDC